MQIIPIRKDLEQYLEKRNLKRKFEKQKNFFKKTLFIQACKQNFLNREK